MGAVRMQSQISSHLSAGEARRSERLGFIKEAKDCDPGGTVVQAGRRLKDRYISPQIYTSRLQVSVGTVLVAHDAESEGLRKGCLARA